MYKNVNMIFLFFIELKSGTFFWGQLRCSIQYVPGIVKRFLSFFSLSPHDGTSNLTI